MSKQGSSTTLPDGSVKQCTYEEDLAMTFLAAGEEEGSSLVTQWQLRRLGGGLGVGQERLPVLVVT
jgi:hypothetical protein